MSLQRLVSTVLLASAILGGSALAVSAQVHVEGYYRNDGTYVQPHYRSAPDGNRYNNYSYPGNTNPYTGRTAPGNSDTYMRRNGTGTYGSPNSLRDPLYGLGR